MDTEGSPDIPQDDGTPVFFGLWAALVRTLESSGESGCSPGGKDHDLFERALCQPIAKSFARSNEEPVDEYLQEARKVLALVFRKAAMHPAIGNAPLENRDREARNYLQRCLRNALLDLAEKNPIAREMRTRLKAALREKHSLLDEGGDEEARFIEGNFGFEMAGVPATRKATQTDIENLEESLPNEKPAGFSNDVDCGLPTADQIAGLLARVIEGTGLGFSEDQLRALAHKVFSVPEAMRVLNLSEPQSEDNDEPPEVSADDLDCNVPLREQIAGMAVAPEIEAAKREIFAIIARRESRTHKKSGTPIRDAFLYFMLHDGEPLDGDEKVSGTLFEGRTGTPDATTLERLQFLQSDFRQSKALQDLGQAAVLAALSAIKSESEESFRKFWGLQPYSDK
jgi:hypothetical protein